MAGCIPRDDSHITSLAVANYERDLATAVSAGECVLPLFGEDDYRFAVCEQQFRGWEMDGSKSV